MDNNQDKQLDYNGLILSHLSRLSAVTTSNVIENVSPELDRKYNNPLTNGEISLTWGVLFLSSIIPEDFEDELFKKDIAYTNLTGVSKEFAKLRRIINLLNRRGLLIQNKVIGYKAKKVIPEDKIREEWEE